MAAAVAAGNASPEVAVPEIVAKLDRFLDTLQAEAKTAMLSNDMAKLDSVEPILDGLKVLLVLVRDSQPTSDLLRALEPFENIDSASALEVAALSAAADAVPEKVRPPKKMRAD